MKRIITVILIISILTAALTAVSYAVTKKDSSEKANKASTEQTQPDTAQGSDAMTLRNYLGYFTGFFHEPYKKGDDISDINLIALSLLFAYANSDSLEYVSFDEKSSELKITQTGLSDIAKKLFGEEVDITEYELKNWDCDYDEESETYTVSFATDYWGEDQYAIDYETPVRITDNGSTVSAVACIYHYPTLGIEENFRTFEYLFEKISDNDMTFYRILEIKEKA